MTSPSPRIVRAEGDSLFDVDGDVYVDLCMGFGAAFLGHANRAVTSAVTAQAARNASPGFLDTDAGESLADALEPWLPAGHCLAGTYAGGTEAVEVAVRVARAATGRKALAGFSGAHHGRSALARALGGAATTDDMAHVYALAFPPRCDSRAVPGAVADCMNRERPAALVIEPVHMSDGGHALDDGTLASVVAIARRHGCLVIFDELLTGGHRTGPRFHHAALDVQPDLLVSGKALAGGFPAALLSVDAGIDVDWRAVGWRSTFTNHPLAAAAIAAALGELRRLRAPARSGEIGAIIDRSLPVARRRGRGAMWSLEWADEAQALTAFRALLEQGVVTSFSGRHMRLLPPLVIHDDNLEDACARISHLMTRLPCPEPPAHSPA